MTNEQRAKIIHKPWTRAESVRDAKADRQRAAEVYEFRQRARREDEKTVATVAVVRDNALTALAYIEARKALKIVQAKALEAVLEKDAQAVREISYDTYGIDSGEQDVHTDALEEMETWNEEGL